MDPYIGCEHHCYYCYALNEAETDWAREIQIHQDIRAQLSNEISSIDTQPVYIGWNSDAYQPLEADYQQTRQALELLAERRFPVCVLTKSDLVVRDMDLFKRMSGSSVGISIAFQNDHDRELFEASAPSNRERVEALIRLHEEGIETYTLICPVMPFITDVGKLVSLVEPYSDTIWIYPLSLDTFEDRNWQNIRQILQEHYPDMAKKYIEIAFNSDHAYWTRLRSELNLLQQQTRPELRIEV
ncbi:MAG: radical SAM protein [Candidatus Aegiribacteria sp.]|nr:radical SAM protein [Candidatus Aegiribacteria sp.]